MKVSVQSGNCGFNTTVTASVDKGYQARLQVDSQCPHVKKMAAALESLNVMDELFKKGKSQIIAASNQYLPHISCPVPISMLKVLEASAKLALPQNVSIEFINE